MRCNREAEAISRATVNSTYLLVMAVPVTVDSFKKFKRNICV
jgi:hypothetical protein